MKRRNVLKSLAACLLFPFARDGGTTTTSTICSYPEDGTEWGDSDSDGYRSYALSQEESFRRGIFPHVIVVVGKQ